MEASILRRINKIRQDLTLSVHIIQGHLKLNGRRMPEATKKDLENVISTLNEKIEEIYQIIRETH